MMILTTLYILSFKEVVADFLYDFSRHHIKTAPTFLPWFTLLSLLTLIVTISNIFFQKGRTKLIRYEMLVLILLFFFLFFSIVFPVNVTAESRYHFDSPAIVYYSIFFNLVFFTLIVGTIIVGCFNAEISFIYLGLVIFVINLITRYCEYAWAMMDRAFFFIGGGIILLVGGFCLERLRRKLLQQIKRTTGNDTA